MTSVLFGRQDPSAAGAAPPMAFPTWDPVTQPIPPPGFIVTPDQMTLLPHDTVAPRLNASIWALIGVSSVFLGLRLYCKFTRHTGLWWDDYVLVASWIAITIESCLLTYATTLGYGLHYWDWPFDPDNAIRMVIAINAGGSLSLTAAIWSKTSFALTIIRLTKGWMKAIIWFVIITTNVSMGLSALFNWVQCTPIAKTWNPFLEGSCWPSYVIIKYNIFSASYSAAMDLSLALVSWTLIWGLQMKFAEKIGVILAMSCGVFAGVTAIVKTSKIPAMGSAEPPSAGIDLFIWGNAESCVTIIAASIPVLRVLVREVSTSAKKYYLSNSDSQGGVSALRSKNRSQKTTLSASATRISQSPKQDDSSERSILDGQPGGRSGKIMRTSEIAVEYQARKEGDSLEYEMDHVPRSGFKHDMA